MRELKVRRESRRKELNYCSLLKTFRIWSTLLGVSDTQLRPLLVHACIA